MAMAEGAAWRVWRVVLPLLLLAVATVEGAWYKTLTNGSTTHIDTEISRAFINMVLDEPWEAATERLAKALPSSCESSLRAAAAASNADLADRLYFVQRKLPSPPGLHALQCYLNTYLSLWKVQLPFRRHENEHLGNGAYWWCFVQPRATPSNDEVRSTLVMQQMRLCMIAVFIQVQARRKQDLWLPEVDRKLQRCALLNRQAIRLHYMPSVAMAINALSARCLVQAQLLSMVRLRALPPLRALRALLPHRRPVHEPFWAVPFDDPPLPRDWPPLLVEDEEAQYVDSSHRPWHVPPRAAPQYVASLVARTLARHVGSPDYIKYPYSNTTGRSGPVFVMTGMSDMKAEPVALNVRDMSVFGGGLRERPIWYLYPLLHNPACVVVLAQRPQRARWWQRGLPSPALAALVGLAAAAAPLATARDGARWAERGRGRRELLRSLLCAAGAWAMAAVFALDFFASVAPPAPASQIRTLRQVNDRIERIFESRVNLFDKSEDDDDLGNILWTKNKTVKRYGVVGFNYTDISSPKVAGAMDSLEAQINYPLLNVHSDAPLHMVDECLVSARYFAFPVNRYWPLRQNLSMLYMHLVEAGIQDKFIRDAQSLSSSRRERAPASPAWRSLGLPALLSSAALLATGLALAAVAFAAEAAVHFLPVLVPRLMDAIRAELFGEAPPTHGREGTAQSTHGREGSGDFKVIRPQAGRASDGTRVQPTRVQEGNNAGKVIRPLAAHQSTRVLVPDVGNPSEMPHPTTQAAEAAPLEPLVVGYPGDKATRPLTAHAPDGSPALRKFTLPRPLAAHAPGGRRLPPSDSPAPEM